MGRARAARVDTAALNAPIARSRDARGADRRPATWAEGDSFLTGRWIACYRFVTVRIVAGHREGNRPVRPSALASDPEPLRPGGTRASGETGPWR